MTRQKKEGNAKAAKELDQEARFFFFKKKKINVPY